MSTQYWQHKSTRQILEQDHLLQALVRHSGYLQQLESAVSQALDAIGVVAIPVSVLRYQSGVLKLHADNQAQATRLRFLEQQLIEELKKLNTFQHLSKLVVRVARTAKARPKQGKTMSLLSVENAGLFRDAAAQYTESSKEDQALRSALLRLSRHFE